MKLTGITQADKTWLLFTHQQRIHWHWSINNSLGGDINIIFISFCLPLLLLSSSEELPFPPPASDELLVPLHPPYELEKHDTVLDLVDHQCACKTISSSFMKTMEVKQLNINVSFRNRRTVFVNFYCSLFILPWKTYCVSFFQLNFFPFEDNKIMQIVRPSWCKSSHVLFLHWQLCWMTLFS